jgi:hypothetical protein
MCWTRRDSNPYLVLCMHVVLQGIRSDLKIFKQTVATKFSETAALKLRSGGGIRTRISCWILKDAAGALIFGPVWWKCSPASIRHSLFQTLSKNWVMTTSFSETDRKGHRDRM